MVCLVEFLRFRAIFWPVSDRFRQCHSLAVCRFSSDSSRAFENGQMDAKIRIKQRKSGDVRTGREPSGRILLRLSTLSLSPASPLFPRISMRVHRQRVR